MKNYKSKPYHIETVGSMRSQCSYGEITRLENIEKAALVHHIYWTLISTESGTVKETKLREDLEGYIHFEYYRQSSLAKAMHKEMLKKRNLYTNNTNHIDDAQCRCALCQSRITEHMRWNVYMRVNGYRYGKKKNEMAKIHQDLHSWMDLPKEERMKD